MKRGDQRIFYIDLLRALATFAVVLLHTAAQNWPAKDITFGQWNVFNIYDSLAQWAVPMFIMLSGILFLDKDREFSIKRLYTHSVFRIAVAFVIWSFLYALYQVYSEGGGVARVIALTLEGHYHMWFLFMITGLYVITPLLRKLTLKEMKYFLILSYILCFIMPTIIEFKNAAKIFMEEGMLAMAADRLFLPYEKFMEYLKIDYLFYFMAGYYLCHREISKKKYDVLLILSVISLVFTISFSAFVTFFKGSAYGIYDPFTVNMSLVTIGIFIFVKERFSGGYTAGKGLGRAVSFISEMSFGIYLAHPMLLELLSNELSVNTLSFSPVLSVPVITVLVFTVSALVTMAIKRIPYVGRYMV